MHVNSIETILKIVFSLHERTHYALHQLNQSSMHKLINILLENYLQCNRWKQHKTSWLYAVLTRSMRSNQWKICLWIEICTLFPTLIVVDIVRAYQWRVHHFSFIFDAVHLIAGNALAMCKSLQLQAIWKFKFQQMKTKQTFADLSILIGW